MTIHTPLQMGADPPAEGYFFFEMWVLFGGAIMGLNQRIWA